MLYHPKTAALATIGSILLHADPDGPEGLGLPIINARTATEAVQDHIPIISPRLDYDKPLAIIPAAIDMAVSVLLLSGRGGY